MVLMKESGVPCRHVDAQIVPPDASVGVLGRPNVLASRALGTLSTLERDRLVLMEVVEARLGAGGVVEEVFVAVGRQDKAEAFIADKSLDRAAHRCHVSLLKTVSNKCDGVIFSGRGDGRVVTIVTPQV